MKSVKRRSAPTIFVDPAIFKSYDIRGTVPDQLNPDVAHLIGRAFAVEIAAPKIAVGRDMRIHSNDLAEAFIDGLLEAGQYFAYQRLPELFCGFDKRESRVPIEYSAASSPQAWASAASMLMLTSILGMEADAEKKLLVLDPHLPADIYRVYLAGLQIGGSYMSFEVISERGRIEVNIAENPDSYRIRLEGRRAA